MVPRDTETACRTCIILHHHQKNSWMAWKRSNLLIFAWSNKYENDSWTCLRDKISSKIFDQTTSSQTKTPQARKKNKARISTPLNTKHCQARFAITVKLIEGRMVLSGSRSWGNPEGWVEVVDITRKGVVYEEPGSEWERTARMGNTSNCAWAPKSFVFQLL